MIIAIDGPAGSGKSTIAKRVAHQKELFYLDTGAMYRMVTLYALRTACDMKNNESVERLLLNCHIEIRDNQFCLNGEMIDQAIRTPEVDRFVSTVAANAQVRESMVAKQRVLSQQSNVILDGRDIGTVVFPHADHKFFLTASVSERADRRFREYEKKGIEASLKEIECEIERRDFEDSHREVSPLKQASDAILIDTTGKTIEQVCEIIIQYIEKSGEFSGCIDKK